MYGVAPNGKAVTTFTRRLRAMGIVDDQEGLSPICRTVRTEYERPRKTPVIGVGDLEFAINVVIPLDRTYQLLGNVPGDEVVEVAP